MWDVSVVVREPVSEEPGQELGSTIEKELNGLGGREGRCVLG